MPSFSLPRTASVVVKLLRLSRAVRAELVPFGVCGVAPAKPVVPSPSVILRLSQARQRLLLLLQVARLIRV